MDHHCLVRRSKASRKRPTRPRVAAVMFFTLALLTLSVTLAACGTSPGANGDNGTTTTAPDSLAHPTDKDELVLQISASGGFLPIQFHLTRVPEFSLYGDGRVIVPGPVIEIYPGPAMPNLQTTTISEEAVQAILAAAREAGLFDTTFDYGMPTITDVPTTTFLVNAGGVTYSTDVYALGEGSEASGLTFEQQQARAALNDLRSELMDLTAFVSNEVTWTPYGYSALAVYSQAVDPNVGPEPTDVTPGRLDWPLGDLSTLGEPIGEDVPGAFWRFVVTGQDLATLQQGSALQEATVITLWKSEDREYHLLFRPLLPDEAA